MKLRAVIVAGLIAVLTMTAGAQQKTPPLEMSVQMVPFRLGCMPTIEALFELLWKEWGELPEFVLELGPEFTGYILTNNDNTTLTWVVVKHMPNSPDESCIVWAGESPGGMAIVQVPKVDESTLPERYAPGERM